MIHQGSKKRSRLLRILADHPDVITLMDQCEILWTKVAQCELGFSQGSIYHLAP